VHAHEINVIKHLFIELDIAIALAFASTHETQAFRLRKFAKREQITFTISARAMSSASSSQFIL